MTGDGRFNEVISTEEQLREIIGYPSHIITRKAIHTLDEYCRAFIARSPFVLIASSDGQGNQDVSPKGDPPGFVQVLDDTTLLIPERPGNRRADTFTNVLQNPKVGLLFLVPGRSESLRVNGQATVVRDLPFRQRMAVRNKIPELLIAVHVEEAFFHCSKCIVRSKLWNADALSESEDLPSLAEVVVKHAELDTPVEEIQAMLDDDKENELY